MPKIEAEYDVKRDTRNRVTLRASRYEYYHVTQYADGSVLLSPRELREPATLSRRTLEDMDAAVWNLEQGNAGDEFDLDEVRDLIDEP